MKIYKLTNNINKKIYIGQTVNGLRNRFWHHKSNKKAHIGKEIESYGSDNFSIELLEECRKERADYLERFWIEKLNSFYPYGYNNQDGGKSGYKMRNKTKAKWIQSKAAKARMISLIDESGRVYKSIREYCQIHSYGEKNFSSRWKGDHYLVGGKKVFKNEL